MFMALLQLRSVNCNAFQGASVVTPIYNKSQKLVSSPLSSNLKKNSIIQSHYELRGGSKVFALDPNFSLGGAFSDTPFRLSTGIFMVTNAVGFIISIITGSHLHLDLIGTGAFTVAALPGLLWSLSTRVRVSSTAVAVWGAKLASFLFLRALKVKTDARLEDTLKSSSGTAAFWIISCLWGVVCSLPHTLGTTSSNAGSQGAVAIGTLLYILGLATETKADYQKWMFKKENPGKFCNEGLWSISQHPNFFGNLLLWFGIYIMNVDSLIEPSGEGVSNGILSSVLGSWRAWVALLSPMFMWTLFYGQSSGAISNSVALANKKYGSDVAFIDYVKNVPLIIPKLTSWLKCLFS